ncbi:unnamed protein product [Lathyrus sativus]|nr:unnamed protein product [Lathyrus sativus]
MSSYSPQQLEDDIVQFSFDKNYALHGKIILLVVVIGFSLFMVFIFMIPCVKKHATRCQEPETGHGDSMEESNNTLYTLKSRR